MSSPSTISGLLPRLSQLSPQGRTILREALLENINRHEPYRRLYGYYPDSGPYRRELYPRHMAFFMAGGQHEPIAPWCPDGCDGSPHRERLALAANRVGKALRHGTLVATPQGWQAIEGLRPGDAVIAGDGSITRVRSVYPQGIKPLFRLTFDVGEFIDCCGEHLWLYQHPAARYPYRGVSAGVSAVNRRFGQWSVANTATILKQVGSHPGPRMRVVIPTCQPWQIAAAAVPLDPYLLGLLIGDGGIKYGVTFTTADGEIVDAIREVLPVGVLLFKKKYDKLSYAISRPGGMGHGRGMLRSELGNPVMLSLRALGLMGLGSAEKFIPDVYKLNSSPMRLAMLQGLMDTDGSINRNGAMEFSSISERLADDVQFLVHSLGGKATIERRQTAYTHLGEKRWGKPSYRVRIRLNVCPFRLKRKSARWNERRNTANRVLHSIEPCGMDFATCIEIEHPSHTYVTAHGIVTHNSEGMGGYELALHLSGRYPDWWPGYKFNRPIEAWAAGKTNETTRDIIQKQVLFGQVAWKGRIKTFSGDRLIPREDIGAVSWKRGVADLADTIAIKSRFGGWSFLGLKSYEQGRGSFEGTAKDVIWYDEEPPLNIYTEGSLRLMTRRGLAMMTFTPMEGMSAVVQAFLPGGRLPGESDW